MLYDDFSDRPFATDRVPCHGGSSRNHEARDNIKPYG